MIGLTIKTNEVVSVHISLIKYLYNEGKSNENISVDEISDIYNALLVLRDLEDNTDEYSIFQVEDELKAWLLMSIKKYFIDELKQEEVNDYDWFMEMLSIYKQLKNEDSGEAQELKKKEINKEIKTQESDIEPTFTEVKPPAKEEVIQPEYEVEEYEEEDIVEL